MGFPGFFKAYPYFIGKICFGYSCLRFFVISSDGGGGLYQLINNNVIPEAKWFGKVSAPSMGLSARRKTQAKP